MSNTAAFRERIQNGETLPGAFAGLGSPLATEVMAIAGYDWIVIDLEHGAGGEGETIAQLQALSGRGPLGIVRVSHLERIVVGRALDAGADGILLPRLENADDARSAVEWTRYAGERGVARYNRGWHWGTLERSFEQVDTDVFCMAQIETLGALEAVDEIAAVDGVDALFVGPADLGFALGVEGGPTAPALLDEAEKVAKAAIAAGKSAGMLVGTVEQARQYAKLGFQLVGCGTDGGLLMNAATTTAREVRAEVPREGQ